MGVGAGEIADGKTSPRRFAAGGDGLGNPAGDIHAPEVDRGNDGLAQSGQCVSVTETIRIAGNPTPAEGNQKMEARHVKNRCPLAERPVDARRSRIDTVTDRRDNGYCGWDYLPL